MNHDDYVQSPEILDEIDQIIYIADMDTHELLFVNSAGRKRIGCGTEYRGKKCFEVLQGLNAVCPFCKNDCLKKNGDACLQNVCEASTEMLPSTNGSTRRF